MADQQLFLETDLIHQAQKGNNAAYGELYTHHLAAIQHYIQKRIGESSDVEDLTQTVFVKAWQALRDYQPSGVPFRAWLYRIAHNAVVDYYRTQRYVLFWDDLTWMVDPQATPEGRVLNCERQETVRRAVADLRPTYQAVVERRFLQELDYTETAEELGQQVNHVRVVQHRALDVLRRVLSQENALWLATVVTVMSLLVGSKIVVAAEQALPGDRLYPMRTWVEETTLFLADDAGDVQLHTRFATQRIMALDSLYQQGRQTDLATAIAAAAVHIRSASTQLATIQTAERTTVTAQFAAALQSQSATVQQLTVTAPQTKTTLEPVLVALTAAQATLPDAAIAPVVPTPTAVAQPMATRVLVPTAIPTVALQVDQSTSAVHSAPAATVPDLSAVVGPANTATTDTTEANAAERDDHNGGPAATATTDGAKPSMVDRPAPEATPSAKPRVEVPMQPGVRPSDVHDENQETNHGPTSAQTTGPINSTHVETAVTVSTVDAAPTTDEAATEKEQRADHEQPHAVTNVTEATQPEPPRAAANQSEPALREHKNEPTR